MRGPVSLDPRMFPDELFESYSVPQFELGAPEIVVGRSFGAAKQAVVPGSVLVCKINPRINRIWVVGDHSPYRKIASTEWVAYPPLKGIEPEYLCYYLRREDFRGFLAQNASGVGGSLMRIKATTFENYTLPVAPQAEQRRIVSAIETQFTRLDAAVASLQRAAASIARYRSSVLKSACEGRLITSNADDLSALQSVEELFTFPTDRGRRVAQSRYETTGPLPIVDQGEGLVAGFTSDEGVSFEGELPVLVFGDHTRRVKYVDFRFAIGAQGVKVLRPRPDLNPKFAYYALQHVRPTDRGYGRHFQFLKRLHLRVPSAKAQTEIVADIERRFSIVEQSEHAIERGLARAARLRQAILQRAFEGKLVPQDPSDEPAEKLLERIQAARGAPQKKGRRIAA